MKKLIALILMGAFLFAVTGCKKKPADEKKPAPDEKKTEEKTAEWKYLSNIK